MKKILTLLFLFFGLLRVMMAQVSVSAALDSTSMLIGDQINITLTITCDGAVALQNADITALDTLKAIEILRISNQQEVKKSPSGRLIQQKITITSFTEGVYNLPQIRIPYVKNGKEGSVYSPTLMLEVKTFDVTDATELQPIKNIIEEPVTIRDFLPYILTGIVLFLIAGLIGYLIKRNRKKEDLAEFEKKRLPAHVIALKKLEKLNAAELWQNGEIKLFQSQLTFILREYLEDRFEIRALESTSDEIIFALKNADIDPQVTDELRNILQTADLVKFAKSEPPVEVHDQAFQNITGFIRATAARPGAPEENTENKVSTDPGNTTHD